MKKLNKKRKVKINDRFMKGLTLFIIFIFMFSSFVPFVKAEEEKKKEPCKGPCDARTECYKDINCMEERIKKDIKNIKPEDVAKLGTKVSQLKPEDLNQITDRLTPAQLNQEARRLDAEGLGKPGVLEKIDFSKSQIQTKELQTALTKKYGANFNVPKDVKGMKIAKNGDMAFGEPPSPLSKETVENLPEGSSVEILAGGKGYIIKEGDKSAEMTGGASASYSEESGLTVKNELGETAVKGGKAKADGNTVEVSGNGGSIDSYSGTCSVILAGGSCKITKDSITGEGTSYEGKDGVLLHGTFTAEKGRTDKIVEARIEPGSQFRKGNTWIMGTDVPVNIGIGRSPAVKKDESNIEIYETEIKGQENIATIRANGAMDLEHKGNDFKTYKDTNLRLVSGYPCEGMEGECIKLDFDSSANNGKILDIEKGNLRMSYEKKDGAVVKKVSTESAMKNEGSKNTLVIQSTDFLSNEQKQRMDSLLAKSQTEEGLILAEELELGLIVQGMTSGIDQEGSTVDLTPGKITFGANYDPLGVRASSEQIIFEGLIENPDSVQAAYLFAERLKNLKETDPDLYNGYVEANTDLAFMLNPLNRKDSTDEEKRAAKEYWSSFVEVQERQEAFAEASSKFNSVLEKNKIEIRETKDGKMIYWDSENKQEYNFEKDPKKLNKNEEFAANFNTMNSLGIEIDSQQNQMAIDFLKAQQTAIGKEIEDTERQSGIMAISEEEAARLNNLISDLRSQKSELEKNTAGIIEGEGELTGEYRTKLGQQVELQSQLSGLLLEKGLHMDENGNILNKDGSAYDIKQSPTMMDIAKKMNALWLTKTTEEIAEETAPKAVPKAVVYTPTIADVKENLVDPKTKKPIFTATLKEGTKSEEVKTLRSMLAYSMVNDADFRDWAVKTHPGFFDANKNGKIDQDWRGRFINAHWESFTADEYDPVLEDVVKEYQKRAGIKADGVAGPMTLLSLYGKENVDAINENAQQEQEYRNEKASDDYVKLIMGKQGTSMGEELEKRGYKIDPKTGEVKETFRFEAADAAEKCKKLDVKGCRSGALKTVTSAGRAVWTGVFGDNALEKAVAVDKDFADKNYKYFINELAVTKQFSEIYTKNLETLGHERAWAIAMKDVEGIAKEKNKREGKSAKAILEKPTLKYGEDKYGNFISVRGKEKVSVKSVIEDRFGFLDNCQQKSACDANTIVAEIERLDAETKTTRKNEKKVGKDGKAYLEVTRNERERELYRNLYNEKEGLVSSYFMQDEVFKTLSPENQKKIKKINARKTQWLADGKITPYALHRLQDNLNAGVQFAFEGAALAGPTETLIKTAAGLGKKGIQITGAISKTIPGSSKVAEIGNVVKTFGGKTITTGKDIGAKGLELAGRIPGAKTVSYAGKKGSEYTLETGKWLKGKLPKIKTIEEIAAENGGIAVYTPTSTFGRTAVESSAWTKNALRAAGHIDDAAELADFLPKPTAATFKSSDDLAKFHGEVKAAAKDIPEAPKTLTFKEKVSNWWENRAKTAPTPNPTEAEAIGKVRVVQNQLDDLAKKMAAKNAVKDDLPKIRASIREAEDALEKAGIRPKYQSKLDNARKGINSAEGKLGADGVVNPKKLTGYNGVLKPIEESSNDFAKIADEIPLAKPVEAKGLVTDTGRKIKEIEQRDDIIIIYYDDGLVEVTTAEKARAILPGDAIEVQNAKTLVNRIDRGEFGASRVPSYKYHDEKIMEISQTGRYGDETVERLKSGNVKFNIKSINDDIFGAGTGHEAGDFYIRATGQRIRETLDNALGKNSYILSNRGAEFRVTAINSEKNLDEVFNAFTKSNFKKSVNDLAAEFAEGTGVKILKDADQLQITGGLSEEFKVLGKSPDDILKLSDDATKQAEGGRKIAEYSFEGKTVQEYAYTKGTKISKYDENEIAKIKNRFGNSEAIEKDFIPDHVSSAQGYDPENTYDILRARINELSDEIEDLRTTKEAPDFNHVSEPGGAKNAFKKFKEGSGRVFSKDEETKSFKEFENWYTGNYNPETGKIKLYRYVDDYADFDAIKAGKADIVPRGLQGKSEQELLAALEKEGQSNSASAETAELYNRYLKGEDISDDAIEYAERSGGGYANDPALYWTTNENPTAFMEGRKYKITVEFAPDEAFRTGKVGKDGKWAGFFDEEAEWTTVGRIKKENIAEIIEQQTGKNVFVKPEKISPMDAKIKELAEAKDKLYEKMLSFETTKGGPLEGRSVILGAESREVGAQKMMQRIAASELDEGALYFTPNQMSDEFYIFKCLGKKCEAIAIDINDAGTYAGTHGEEATRLMKEKIFREVMDSKTPAEMQARVLNLDLRDIEVLCGKVKCTAKPSISIGHTTMDLTDPAVVNKLGSKNIAQEMFGEADMRAINSKGILKNARTNANGKITSELGYGGSKDMTKVLAKKKNIRDFKYVDDIEREKFEFMLKKSGLNVFEAEENIAANIPENIPESAVSGISAISSKTKIVDMPVSQQEFSGVEQTYWGSEKLEIPKYGTFSFNPKNKIDATGNIVINSPTDTVYLTRRVYTDKDTARHILSNGEGWSNAMNKAGGDFDQALKRYLDSWKQDKYRELGYGGESTESILSTTWMGGGESIGVSTSLYEDVIKSVKHEPLLGEVELRYDIEIPAGKIIKPTGVLDRPENLKLPKGLTREQAMKEGYAFIGPGGYEGEVTFIGEIPEEYIQSISASSYARDINPSDLPNDYVNAAIES